MSAKIRGLCLRKQKADSKDSKVPRRNVQCTAGMNLAREVKIRLRDTFCVGRTWFLAYIVLYLGLLWAVKVTLWGWISPWVVHTRFGRFPI
jgi:hypothetical protein